VFDRRLGWHIARLAYTQCSGPLGSGSLFGV
jgi:hypothetical protein